ncbi:MAG: phosphomevalonate kinase [Myxococcota bacterium]|jgi:phosphomevalonate kinase
MRPFAEVRAPGKLVLLGEYAVLDGAPALVIAIDRGVRCEIVEGNGIETPDGDTRFVAPALINAPQALYRFSSWNPVDLPGKPGFGGSAAACVAACVAAGRPASDAFAIHHAVQGGGSGIDIAASIHGGALWFEDGAPRPAAPLPQPPSVIWSGCSAKTGPRVRQYRAWADADPAGKQRFLDRSRAATDLAGDDPIVAFRLCYAALVEMSEAAGVAYRSAGLDVIVALAAERGGAAKPSGAGGGDCAVAIFSDAAQQADFEAACAAEGLVPIPVALSEGAAASPVR